MKNKYPKHQRLALLEQGVNGIAELYAELRARLDVIEGKIEDANKEIAAGADVNDEMQRQLQAHTDDIAKLQEGFARCAKQVDALALGERCDYYNRGVLDEYMYGDAKEDDKWKKA